MTGAELKQCYMGKRGNEILPFLNPLYSLSMHFKRLWLSQLSKEKADVLSCGCKLYLQEI